MGELVLSTDEKTGILIRRRKHPTRPCRPGQARRREREYVRLGSTHLSATFCVPTGQVAYDLTRTHNGDDFAKTISLSGDRIEIRYSGVRPGHIVANEFTVDLERAVLAGVAAARTFRWE